MLRPFEDGLVMQQLLYAAEVRAISELEIPGVAVKDAELKLARQLIEQQSSAAFDPAAYTDAVRERIEAAVEKKVEGQEITLPEAPAGGAQIIDLMEALRQSLERKGAAAAPQAKVRKPLAGGPVDRPEAGAKKQGCRFPMQRCAVRTVEKLLRLPHDPRTDRGRIRIAGPRPAWRLAVLVPGPDRAARRLDAGPGGPVAPAHHPFPEAAARTASGQCAALWAAHWRSR
jgi:hypothetical protein